ncbi:MAG TPA: DNA-directed RNA polymerase subunit omega [Candidatus Sumerlaeota bacterium]|nr:DNA-directed RNA polymerase subunit omega [Candidatus Sumerlaeota bacterium]
MYMQSEDLKKKYENRDQRYFIVNVVSRRARGLVDGEKPVVETEDSMRPRDIAEKEIVSGKLQVRPRNKQHKIVDIVREVSDRS